MEKQQNNPANAQAMVIALVLIGLVVFGIWITGVRI